MFRKRLAFVSLALGFLLASSDTVCAGSILVTSADDSGAGTLRAAITAANANAGMDVIAFEIPGAGVKTILLASNLPEIVDPVTIDGFTQGVAHANTLEIGNDAMPLIEIDANDVAADGIILRGPESGGSTIRGLAITGGFLGGPGRSGAKIHIEQSDGNLIEGNFIGPDAAGMVGLGSGVGVRVVNSSLNTIGGTSPAARNWIAGNGETGVEVRAQFAPSGPSISDDNVIRGNYIGTNAAGTMSVGNGIGINIDFQVTDTRVGGTEAGAGNVISGNAGFGIWIQVSTGTLVQGNRIGTDVTGTAPLGNGADGIFLYTVANDNTIGGSVAGAGNVIAGNTGPGIRLRNGSTGNRILGNFIGVGVTGESIGNGADGIRVDDGSDNTTIGDTHAGEGNVIAHNVGAGVALGVNEDDQGVSNSPILGNSIHSNGELGIDLLDLGQAGVSTNDPDDSDSGPNGLQNYPILTSAISRGSGLSISGTLHSNPSTEYRIELFANAACDPAGHGEAQSYLGSVDVNTDQNGDLSFGPIQLSAPVGQAAITSTATTASGNTSELSECLSAAPGPTETPTATQTPTATASSTPLVAGQPTPRSGSLLAVLALGVALMLLPGAIVRDDQSLPALTTRSTPAPDSFVANKVQRQAVSSRNDRAGSIPRTRLAGT